MQEILQTRLPYEIDPAHRLPGTRPLDEAQWLLRDEAFAGQMALREALLSTRREDVVRLSDRARPAAAELLETVLAFLATDSGYSRAGGVITRPDGGKVALDRDDPMGTLGRLVQEDFCLLEKAPGEEEHVLTGAVLCFPASWTLAEKFLHPMIRIHRPVAAYDENIAKRVQRLFDGVQVGRPLWRYNYLHHGNPALYQPQSETRKDYASYSKAPQTYIRSERQTMRRLPETRAVVFGIHTYILRREAEVL
ncbi:heme-dependent oxidative N-demethylase family protein [Pseudooceanicola sp. 502str34]